MWTTWKHTGSHCRGSIAAEQLLCVHVAAGQVFGWKSRSFFNIRPVVQRSESSSGTCIVYMEKEYLFLGDFSALPSRCFLHCPAPSPRCAPQPAHVSVTIPAFCYSRSHWGELPWGGHRHYKKPYFESACWCCAASASCSETVLIINWS